MVRLKLDPTLQQTTMISIVLVPVLPQNLKARTHKKGMALPNLLGTFFFLTIPRNCIEFTTTFLKVCLLVNNLTHSADLFFIVYFTSFSMNAEVLNFRILLYCWSLRLSHIEISFLYLSFQSCSAECLSHHHTIFGKNYSKVLLGKRMLSPLLLFII